jgi:HlyD family secretion protein
MLRRLALLGICIGMVASLVSCSGPKLPATPTPTPTLEPGAALAPSPTPIVETVVNADGALVSLQPTLGLGFQVSGRVVEVLVRPGESVKAGQVLARLDKLTFENAVRDASARLEQARFDLDKAKQSAEAGMELEAAQKSVEAARIGLTNAYGTYTSTLLSADVSADVRQAKAMADFWASELGDAWLRLDDKPDSDKRRMEYELAGARSAEAHNTMVKIQVDAGNRISAAKRSIASAQQSYLTALANYNTLKNSDPVRQAELQVMLNETTLTRAQMDLVNTELKAPWDAMVATVEIATGSQAGLSPAVTLADISHLQFVTNNLSERDLGRIAPGQSATLLLKAFPDATLTGTVASIAPLPGAPVGDAATFAVRIDLAPSELPLRPGMTGQVQIVVK